MFFRMLIVVAFILLQVEYHGTNAQTITKTYTTLSGFYDYQSNGGACQYIRASQSNSILHSIYMLSIDSLNPSVARRTGYAMSTNNGTTWINFSNIHIPPRRSGFPTMDVWRPGTTECIAIASHSEQIVVYSSCFPSYGIFDELLPPPPFGGDEPIWPAIAGTADSGLVVVGSRSVAATVHVRRYDLPLPWTPVPCEGSAGRNVATASSTDRVAILLNSVNGGLSVFESTNNGINWPSQCRRVHDSVRIAGADTFQCWVGSDAVYRGDSIIAALSEINVGGNSANDGAQIVFWSGATGYRVVATRADIPGIAPRMNRDQRNHTTLGYPAIGVSGSVIVLTFMAFRAETSSVGFNYGEIYFCQSTDAGYTWSTPLNVSNTSTLDERYPSMAKWNPPGTANFVWQEDREPGSHVLYDNAPVSRSQQVFCRILNPTSRPDDHRVPNKFELFQNYPNPFNPTTTINYQLPTTSHVTLKVFDLLGREVATLVNEVKEAGMHEVRFDASNLSSGVYCYTLRSGSFIETKMMALIR